MDDNIIMMLTEKINKTKENLKVTETTIKLNMGDAYPSSPQKEQIEKYYKVLEALEKYIEKEKERQKERSIRYQEARRKMQISINKMELVKDRIVSQNATNMLFGETLKVEQGYQDSDFDAEVASEKIATIDSTFGLEVVYDLQYKQDFRVLLDNIKAVYEVEDLQETTEKLEKSPSFMFFEHSSNIIFDAAVQETSELTEALMSFETPDPNANKDETDLTNCLNAVLGESSKIGTEDYSKSVIDNLDKEVDYLTKKQEENDIERQEEELTAKMESATEKLDRDVDRIIVLETTELLRRLTAETNKLEELAARMVDVNMVKDYAKFIDSQLEECQQMLLACNDIEAQNLLTKATELRDRCYDCVDIYNNELENLVPTLKLDKNDDDQTN